MNGVDAFDDSKGTNVGATVAALNGLGADKAPAKLVVILGGDGKGQDFAPLADAVARRARAVVLIGRDGPAIGKARLRNQRTEPSGRTTRNSASVYTPRRYCSMCSTARSRSSG